MSLEALRGAVRDIPDFPSPGIVFRDITPVLADAALLRESITRLCEAAEGQTIDKVVGIDARGFIFGAAVADRLGAGFVPVRKHGKLPWKTREARYSLEYGESCVAIHEDALCAGERVLVVDDLLATGGTAAATIDLLTQFDVSIVALTFLIELGPLHGRERLAPHPVISILTYA